MQNVTVFIMISRISQGLRHYLQAAPLPHLTTLKTGGLAFLSWTEARVLWTQPEPQWALWIWGGLSILFAWGVVLCQADALARYQEFKRVHRMLARFGFCPRIIRPVSTSRCQRDAALLAAREAGYQKQALHVFRTLGYRWYHILPDAIRANPFFFFHPHFLRTTFLPSKRNQ